MNKVIVKEPGKGLVIENVEKVDLDYFYSKCGSPIDMMEVGEGVDIVFNDEMLMSDEFEPNFCFFSNGRIQPLHGTVIFVGVDYSTGKSKGLTNDEIIAIYESFADEEK